MLPRRDRNPSARHSGRGVVYLALLPMAAAVLACLAALAWSLRVSLSSSHALPVDDFVGLAQYARLLHDARWMLSLRNMFVFGMVVVPACLVIGFLLAVCIDRQVRAANWLQAIFLYPYAISFIATGLVWQWMLNPELGIQAAIRALGWQGFQFDWIVRPDTVIFAVALAAVWQACGLVMALMLVDLRGIDENLWHAARIDGVPAWRIYASVVIPLMKPSIGASLVLLILGAVKLFDLVVAMTQGGPGIASEAPAKFIVDYLFGRASIGLASAASVVLLTTVVAVLAPWLYLRSRQARRANFAR